MAALLGQSRDLTWVPPDRSTRASSTKYGRGWLLTYIEKDMWGAPLLLYTETACDQQNIIQRNLFIWIIPSNSFKNSCTENDWRLGTTHLLINILRGRYFLSCSEWGLKKKTLSSYEKSNPRILRSDALPLSHRDSGEEKPQKSLYMTRVLHTARISNTDGVVFCK